LGKNGISPTSQGDFIGYFVFVDGKFRWDSTIKVLSVRRIGAGGNSSTQGASSTQTDRGNVDGSPSRSGSRGVGYPSCEYCPSPEYPKNDKAKHVEGTIVLQVVVQPYGQATDIKVMKTPDQDFAEMAIEAVEKWRFKAALDQNGQPVAVVVPIDSDVSPVELNGRLGSPKIHPPPDCRARFVVLASAFRRLLSGSSDRASVRPFSQSVQGEPFTWFVQGEPFT